MNEGNWDGEQIIPAEWVAASTRLDTTTDPADNYQYFWWVDVSDPARHRYYAAGKYGQYIYVIPDQKLIFVRFGVTDPRRVWRDFFDDLGQKIGAPLP